VDDLFKLGAKRALVLGGGQGIGAGISLLLAQAGARVAIADLEIERAASVATAAGDGAIALQGDVLDDVQLVQLVDQAESQLAGLDILVCIVGMATFKPAVELTAEDWDLDQRRNLRYVFLAAQAFAKRAIAHKRPGVIACLSSMSGVRSGSGHAAYGAAKYAIVNLVRTLAVEWARHDIRINVITPGSIATPNFPDSAESRDILAKSLVPMGRSGTIDEISKPLLVLCSDMARYITGHNLYVDGGWGAANLFG
jgi:NAD(P)-dependent dehydrogenase (short-subunit alcohol dehydrogenase family)